MTARESLLDRGIAAAKAGDRGAARRLLTRAVRRDPGSESAWLWLSSVFDTPQSRAFCLQRVIALNPDNQVARRALAALEAAASEPAESPASLPEEPAVAAGPAAEPPSAALEELAIASVPSSVALVEPTVSDQATRRWVAVGSLVRRPRFWQVVVACLAIVALGLVGVLAYAAFNGPGPAEEDALAAAIALPTPWPRGTLRPTFTTTPTKTPTPTDTPTPTPTPTPTFTPTPTDSPTPTLTPTSTPRARRQSATATPRPAPTARPTLAPRALDGRLAELGVRVEPAFTGAGQSYWRLVEARWSNEKESAGKHSIYVNALDADGKRTVGQPVIVQWSNGNVVLPTRDLPPPDWSMNFGMYNVLGSYAVSVGGAPSDRIVGLGLGTAEQPAFTIHTCFYLTFQLVTH
jgi:hypothetical protein